jgi:hypothetical protein
VLLRNARGLCVLLYLTALTWQRRSDRTSCVCAETEISVIETVVPLQSTYRGSHAMLMELSRTYAMNLRRSAGLNAAITFGCVAQGKYEGPSTVPA